MGGPIRPVTCVCTTNCSSAAVICLYVTLKLERPEASEDTVQTMLKLVPSRETTFTLGKARKLWTHQRSRNTLCSASREHGKGSNIQETS